MEEQDKEQVIPKSINFALNDAINEHIKLISESTGITSKTGVIRHCIIKEAERIRQDNKSN